MTRRQCQRENPDRWATGGSGEVVGIRDETIPGPADLTRLNGPLRILVPRVVKGGWEPKPDDCDRGRTNLIFAT